MFMIMSIYKAHVLDYVAFHALQGNPRLVYSVLSFFAAKADFQILPRLLPSPSTTVPLAGAVCLASTSERLSSGISYNVAI